MDDYLMGFWQARIATPCRLEALSSAQWLIARHNNKDI